MTGGEAGFHEEAEEAHTWRSGLNSRKLDRHAQPHQPPTQLPTCPECGSQRTWKDGIRYTNRGEVQRHICRACGYRFSENPWKGSDPPEHVRRVHTTALYSDSALPFNRQVCVTETQGAKNLAEVESRTQKRAAGATKLDSATIQGKIIEFAWQLKKQGYKEPTIRQKTRMLTRLVESGADLLDPESVKEAIAKQESWCENSKVQAVWAYDTFATMNGIFWELPKYKRGAKLPWIPSETEIDQLIAGLSKKVGTFTQVVRETGARPGEVARIKWIDIDFEKHVLRINDPEKGSNPRICSISSKLVGMLNALPRTSERVFGRSLLRHLTNNFLEQRKHLAEKLQNPRIKELTWRTLRHWKGTTEYHKSKDILYVMKVLGHKSIKSTLVYIDVERAIYQPGSEEFTVRVAKTIEEASKLIEVGFEYVYQKDDVILFRKRK